MASRFIPRYFAVLAYGTFVPLMKIGCCLITLFVKSVCTDLDSLGFIRHFLFQIMTLLTADCSFLVEHSAVSPIAMTAVSSTNMAMVLFDRAATQLFLVAVYFAAGAKSTSSS
jgi:hypothetical protein